MSKSKADYTKLLEAIVKARHAMILHADRIYKQTGGKGDRSWAGNGLWSAIDHLDAQLLEHADVNYGIIEEVMQRLDLKRGVESDQVPG